MSDVLDSLRAFVATVVRDELAKSRAHAAPTVGHLTIAMYAARLSISESTVRKALGEGRIDCVRIGRAVRIPVDAKIRPRARVRDATDRARAILLRGKVG